MRPRNAIFCIFKCNRILNPWSLPLNESFTVDFIGNLMKRRQLFILRKRTIWVKFAEVRHVQMASASAQDPPDLVVGVAPPSMASCSSGWNIFFLKKRKRLVSAQAKLYWEANKAHPSRRTITSGLFFCAACPASFFEGRKHSHPAPALRRLQWNSQPTLWCDWHQLCNYNDHTARGRNESADICHRFTCIRRRWSALTLASVWLSFVGKFWNERPNFVFKVAFSCSICG